MLRAFAPEEMARQAGRPVTTAAEALGWIAARESERQAGSAYTWAVVRDGVPLGSVAVAAVNHRPRHRLGLLLDRRNGTRHAASRLRAYGHWPAGPSTTWGSTGWSSVTGRTTPPPARCAMRAGFAAEGIERQKLRYGDVRYDVERHARLADDDVNQG